jgi:hypothetical protein
MSIAIDPEGIYWKFFTILGKRTNTITKCYKKTEQNSWRSCHLYLLWTPKKLFLTEILVTGIPLLIYLSSISST